MARLSRKPLARHRHDGAPIVWRTDKSSVHTDRFVRLS
ncbi:hypothetical protein OH687_17905 [Burkholderia anthina]|nr:hypothetical protein OH687_17905 [Burkholderia anthina]